MAVRLTLPVIFFSSHFPPSSSRSRSKTCCSSSASSSQMEFNNEFGVTKFKEFPYLSAPHRNLMVDLVSTVENRLGSQLLPCSLPPDVQYYQNQTGSAHASLHTRSGNKPSHSQVWFHFSSLLLIIGTEFMPFLVVNNSLSFQPLGRLNGTKTNIIFFFYFHWKRQQGCSSKDYS